ncbi:hypothetical protein B0H16DRAFT_1469514 [Mycena metata]|uniref:Uncharacterized protein n=1 Tax=Mycena metata TaxID=1033252 RepID=A0AAD7MTY2_9AGAR|nr:hypothetical protein B0H16DRAFT_1469514 [Mycena metata]
MNRRGLTCAEFILRKLGQSNAASSSIHKSRGRYYGEGHTLICYSDLPVNADRMICTMLSKHEEEGARRGINSSILVAFESKLSQQDAEHVAAGTRNNNIVNMNRLQSYLIMRAKWGWDLCLVFYKKKGRISLRNAERQESTTSCPSTRWRAARTSTSKTAVIGGNGADSPQHWTILRWGNILPTPGACPAKSTRLFATARSTMSLDLSRNTNDPATGILQPLRFAAALQDSLGGVLKVRFEGLYAHKGYSIHLQEAPPGIIPGAQLAHSSSGIATPSFPRQGAMKKPGDSQTCLCMKRINGKPSDTRCTLSLLTISSYRKEKRWWWRSRKMYKYMLTRALREQGFRLPRCRFGFGSSCIGIGGGRRIQQHRDWCCYGRVQGDLDGAQATCPREARVGSGSFQVGLGTVRHVGPTAREDTTPLRCRGREVARQVGESESQIGDRPTSGDKATFINKLKYRK